MFQHTHANGSEFLTTLSSIMFSGVPTVLGPLMASLTSNIVDVSDRSFAKPLLVHTGGWASEAPVLPSMVIRKLAGILSSIDPHFMQRRTLEVNLGKPYLCVNLLVMIPGQNTVVVRVDVFTLRVEYRSYWQVTTSVGVLFAVEGTTLQLYASATTDWHVKPRQRNFRVWWGIVRKMQNRRTERSQIFPKLIEELKA